MEISTEGVRLFGRKVKLLLIIVNTLIVIVIQACRQQRVLKWHTAPLMQNDNDSYY